MIDIIAKKESSDAFDYFSRMESRLTSLETSQTAVREDFRRLEATFNEGLRTLAASIESRRLSVFQVWAPVIATLALIVTVGGYMMESVKTDIAAEAAARIRLEDRLLAD
jgi:hypothetical protein